MLDGHPLLDVSTTTNVPLLAIVNATEENAIASEIDARLAETREVVELTLPYADGATLAWLFEHGDVLERQDKEDGVHLRVGLEPADSARLKVRLA